MSGSFETVYNYG